MKTVKQVAKLTGTSVRTLQYYDQMRLLEPSTRSAAGYRLYSDDDVARLRQILLLRELGFPLKDIQSLIHTPQTDQHSAFKRQKELLLNGRKHTDRMINILSRLENGASLDDCADDLNRLSNERRNISNHLKLILLFCLPLLAISALVIYQTSQSTTSSDSPVNPEILANPGSIEDRIYINTDIPSSTTCWYIDVRDFDSALLPADAPKIDQLDLPTRLQGSAGTKAIYGVDLDSGEMTNFINYALYAKNPEDPDQYIYIGFSADQIPIRELYIPAGESSLINGRDILLGSRSTPDMSGGESTIYVADFSTDSYTFNVEAHGLDQAEFIALLRSLL